MNCDGHTPIRYRDEDGDWHCLLCGRWEPSLDRYKFAMDLTPDAQARLEKLKGLK